jgi:rod shape-determining protein MreD
VRNWIFLFIIVIFALLQTSILDCIDIFNVKPDLLLIAVIYASLSFEFKYALSLSIFAGVLKDVLAVNTFGINTLLFPLVSLLLIKLSREISLDNNFIYMVSTFIITLLGDIITRIIFLFLGNYILWGIFLRTAILESLYTALVLPLVFKVIKPVLYSSRAL